MRAGARPQAPLNICVWMHTLNIVWTGAMSNAGNSLIVADSWLRNIYQVDATSGATAQLLPFGVASEPMALAYDSTVKLLYWTEYSAHTINRYSLLTHSTTIIYRDPSDIGKNNVKVIRLESSRLLYSRFMFAYVD